MLNKLKLLFIPHRDNNHRAILLQPGALLILVAVYLLNQAVLKSLSVIRPGVLGYSSEITIEKVFAQTNLQRQQSGLSDLKFSATLSKSAAAKAQDMFEHDYWAHNSPQGKTPWEFFKQSGYQYTVAGENLARDFYDTESLMKAWMKSPTHKANIISPKYQEIGLAVVNGTLNGVKTTLVVQHFGTPLSGVVEDTKIDTVVYTADQSPVQGAIALPTTNLINPHTISRTFGFIIFGIIVGVLIVDGYMALTRKTKRFSGSNSGHIGFIVIILILLVFSQQGSIF